MENFEQERFTVYTLSKKARIVVKEGSRTITIIKKVRVNPIAFAEVQLRINGDELAALFHVMNMRTLTDEAIKAITAKHTNKEERGADHAADEE